MLPFRSNSFSFFFLFAYYPFLSLVYIRSLCQIDYPQESQIFKIKLKQYIKSIKSSKHCNFVIISNFFYSSISLIPIFFLSCLQISPTAIVCLPRVARLSDLHDIIIVPKNQWELILILKPIFLRYYPGSVPHIIRSNIAYILPI